MPWTEQEENKLRRLAGQNRYFYTEIAKDLNKTPQSVRWKAKQLGMQSTQKTLVHRFGKWNAKHSHLRKAAMTYFLSHSVEETRKKFGLTESQIKSLFTVGYRLAEFKHLRKDKRDHSPWSTRQLIFLLRHAGLRPRKWIAAQIGRGNEVCIKERMQKLGLASRTLQGLTLSQFKVVFGERPDFFLQTDAGPDGGNKGSLPTRWRIIPWVWLDQELKLKRLKTNKEFALLVSVHARFQEWIFKGNALKKMKRIVRTAGV